MFSAFRSLFQRQSPAPSVAPALPARKLAAAIEAEFLTRFHLEPDDELTSVDAGIRHRFRPSGESFRGLVVLDVVTDAIDGMLSASLCLDRSFVSGPEEAFARDIAKGFLDWVLEDEAHERAQPLIAHIGNLAEANAPAMTAEPPPQPRDASDAYAVFTGDGDVAALMLGATRLTLTNARGRLTIAAMLVE